MVQADVRQLLLSAPLNLVDENLEDIFLESQTGDRHRIDVEVGATIIEVKKDLRAGNVRREALPQLRGYVVSREESFGQRYVGILTDGADWACYHLERGELVLVSEIRVLSKEPNVERLLVWLEGVLATTRNVRPLPDEIRLRLGTGSSSHSLDRATMAALYEQHKGNPRVRTKRKLWARLLETALGTQFEDSDELFVEHTLLVNSAEIIAHAVLGLPVETIEPAHLLSGAEFDKADVHGVVEADFFDWVVDVQGGDAFVRTLARRLARFDWSSVEHDVLKVLYESVIGPDVRKRLGEYYTPDWLAQVVVDSEVKTPLEDRVLDPSCGSGTFLFHAVRRYLAAARAAGRSIPAMLEGVTHHVFGMDLHPVAVTLARVTYLLAIGRENLQADGRPVIQVPVYLGDSVQWQQRTANLFSAPNFRITADEEPGAETARFEFPSELLKDTRRFDALVKSLALRASSRKRGTEPPSLAGVYGHHKIPASMHQTIDATFALMCRLHDEGRDHIWGYYIRNQARPEWLAREENRVDVLLGNPPWLAYRFMSAAMQADFQRMSKERKLWSGSKVATQQDLSGLFVVRMIELYLRREGRFAFVMPDAVLDRGQFRGFQSGAFDRSTEHLRVSFHTPWNLRRLRPHFFPRGAAVVFGRRSTAAGAMPRAEEWSGRLPSVNAAWAAVGAAIQRTAPPQVKVRVSAGSPYHSRFRNGATIFPRMLFMVEKQKAGPLGRAGGRVGVKSARSTYEKAPWKDIAGLEGAVEKAFVRAVHLGETILPYRPLTPVDAVIPRDVDGFMAGNDQRIERYPGLADWWRRAEACWEANRSSDRLTLLEQLDFNGKASSQFPIHAERVVYAKAGMHVAAARLTDRNAVIDHKLYWASVRSTAEAHFLCAILNSATLTRLVRPLMSYGKDERDIDKHLWKLPIPLFESADARHLELARLGERAESEVAALDLDVEKHFAASRRAVREHLETSATGKRIEELVASLLGESQV